MNGEMKIKVCGMRDGANVEAVAQLDIDMMGFIFHPGSPRCVEALPEEAFAMGGVELVGVFVDANPFDMLQAIDANRLDWVQLHGDEQPCLIENLRAMCEESDIRCPQFIKAIGVDEAKDIERAAVFEGVADMLLFDTRCPQHGGSGTAFDWDVLSAYTGHTPFLLSGGIGPEDAARVLAFNHPQCVGIDINSRFEMEPAVKDVERLRRFIEALR